MRLATYFLLFFFLCSCATLTPTKQNPAQLDGEIMEGPIILKPAFADMSYLSFSDTVNTFARKIIVERGLTTSQERDVFIGSDLFYQAAFGKISTDSLQAYNSSLTKSDTTSAKAFVEITKHFVQFQQ